jgi:hypothetical protein
MRNPWSISKHCRDCLRTIMSCTLCDRSHVLDLAALIRAGCGTRRLPLLVRCSICGRHGTSAMATDAITR